MRAAEDVLVVRSIHVDQMAECQALYAKVMHLRPGDGGINARLLSAVQANGGLVLGAYAENELVGFAYSFVGRDAQTPDDAIYQYSQLTVVASTWQGRGVGRRLKFAQREACLALGIRRMRWAFDPMKTRNGHFNLSVLGARIVKFVPVMYGERGFGDGTAANTTDRFVVEWDLENPSVAPAMGIPETVARGARFATIVRHDGNTFVPIPADWARFRAEREWPEAERLVADYRAVFSELLESGWVGVRCDLVSEDMAAYRFVLAHDASDLTSTGERS